MHDGERVEVRGSTGARYQLSRTGDVYMCTCPAWTKQTRPPAQRTCKHLRERLGDASETLRIGAAPAPPGPRRESVALRARRDAALTTALARFPAVEAKMRAVYDMPLPRYLAYSAAFWAGLTAEEREEAWSYIGCGPAGILDWFEDDGLLRPALADERLDYRYRCDPPEFVTVYTGNSDGGHWGLWYDDPRELPRLVGFNYARDDACTYATGPTVLSSLRRHMTRERRPAGEYPHAARVLAWLDDLQRLELTAHREQAIAPPPTRGSACFAGLDPWIDGTPMPDDLAAPGAQDARYKLFREAPGEAGPVIDRARDELAAGQPMRALLIGRELHWVDSDELRAAATELLVGAYRALGRDALAGVTIAHHGNRDLRSVGVYGPVPAPPLAPLAAAARDGDIVALTEMLASGPPDTDTIAAAIGQARTLEVFTLLLPHATSVMLDTRIGELVDIMHHLRELPEYFAAHEAVVDLLLAHGASPAVALARALNAGLPALALRLAATADPRATDTEGKTPLHHAAFAGDADVVRALLARGADPQARDARGATPLDRARDLWQTRRADSLVIMGLLQPPAPVAPPTGPPTVGETVVHAQFGAGLVEASEGAGEATKLRIQFEGGTRTLLARFVRRAP